MPEWIREAHGYMGFFGVYDESACSINRRRQSVEKKGEQKMDKTAKIRMKAKRNVTDLAGEKVMVDFEQGKYFCIKGVGNDIWDMLDGQEGEDGITVEAILHKLMEEYEVMEEVCEKEVLAFLEKLEQAGILEEV